MSHVLKRLIVVADGNVGHVKGHLPCITLLTSRDPRKTLSSSAVGINIRFRSIKQRESSIWQNNKAKPAEMIIGFNSHGKKSMSILTDLLKRKKKDDYDDEDEPIPEPKTLALFDDAPKSLTDEEIEAKRDISRLNPNHRRLVHGQLPYTEPMFWAHHTVRYKQRMYGRYGESSGVNPGLLWPTREDLARKQEYESICHPLTIQEMVEKKARQRQLDKEFMERRRIFIEKNMEMVDKFKQDLQNRIAAKEKEANEAKARREKLMEEVRRHFGYTIDSRDERFQELLAKKEKEQKKQMKEARKLEKQQKMLQKLEGKSAKRISATTQETDVVKDD